MKQIVFKVGAVILPVVMIGFLGACSHSKSAHTKRLPGVWQDSPIVIDGKSNDWPQPYPEYDSKAMIGYAVSNDKDNLYVTVESGDPATQYKIVRGGLTVWLDKTGNKEQTVAINYPIPPDNSQVNSDGSSHSSESGSSGGQGKKMDMTERVKKALSKANQFSLQGFKACNAQYSINEKDSCGIQVKIALDENNELIWEAKIPFKAFYTKAEIEARDRGKALSICFETTALKRPAGQHDGSGGNHGGGGMGGMRPSMGFGGGMRFGGGGGRGGSRGGSSTPNPNEQMYKSTTTWKHFGIAYKAPPAPPVTPQN